jgi:S-DNA-T family DNA segregation ATPase FtsK/SpoIIIE
MLSMFDPIPIGVDEFGQRVDLLMAYRNQLNAGTPDAGKSSFIQNIGCYGLLCDRVKFVLLDGKLVEFGLMRPALGPGDIFVGRDLDQAIRVLERLQKMIDNRLDWLAARRRRKFTRDDNINTYLLQIDEVATYTTASGTPQQRAYFIELLRDVIARGRAVLVIGVIATQRPSIDIIPKSLRDIFAYRAAFRCMSDGSSDIILGDGWSGKGYSAADISLTSPGVCYLIAENGLRPRKIKASYLTDDQIIHIVDFAAWTRRTGRTDTHAAAQVAHPFTEAA